MKLLAPLSAVTAALTLTAFTALPAQAQSTEEVLGALIGGSAGSLIGNELGSGGDVIGAVVGGSLGYYVGDQINDRNRYQRQYTQQHAYNQGYQAASDYNQYGGRVVYKSPHVTSQNYGYSQPRPVYTQPSYSQPRYTQPEQVYRSYPQAGYVQTHQPVRTYRHSSRRW